MSSLIYSLNPEIGISLGISSAFSGSLSVNFIRNPYATEKERLTSISLGASSIMMGASVTGTSLEAVQDLNEIEAYIQSLSKEELEELSSELNLIAINEEIIDDLKYQSIGQINEIHNEIEKTKKYSIWG